MMTLAEAMLEYNQQEEDELMKKIEALQKERDLINQKLRKLYKLRRNL